MTDKEKFLKLMEEFGVKVIDKRVGAYDYCQVSNTAYMDVDFVFYENGEFDYLHCYC